MASLKNKVSQQSRKMNRWYRERFNSLCLSCQRPFLYHGLRFILPVGLAWFALYLTPGREIPDPFVDIQVGRVADRDVVAPFEFQVFKSEAEIQHEREKAAAEVLPILEYQPQVKEIVLGDILEFFNRLHSITQDSGLARQIPRWEDYSRRKSSGRNGYSAGPPLLRALFRVDSLLSLSDDEIVYLLDPERSRVLRNSLKDFIIYRLREGLIDGGALGRIDGDFVVLHREGNESLTQKSELATLRQAVDAARSETLDPRTPEVGKNLFINLLTRFLKPNIVYEQAETENQRSMARQRVKITRDQTVLKGEKLIGRGERVTPLQLERLDNLKLQLAQRQGAAGRIGQVRRNAGIYLIYLLLLLPFWLYLLLHREDVYCRLAPLLIITLNIMIVLGFSYLVLENQDLSIYLIPAAITPMLIAYLIDDKVALATMFSLSLVIGIQAGFSIYAALFALVGGVAGAISVRRIKTRKGQYLSILYIGGAYMLTLLAIDYGYRGENFMDVTAAFGWAMVNAFLVTMATIGLLPLLEVIFKVTSNFTLLELGDLNRPLLKRLAIEAPGTYHHSIILGNLAEAAAAGIGANSIFARVAAYYHDIGKLRNPQYFVENQAGGENPHNKLSPKMSSLIICNHVKEGVELARQARLPECIIDIIRQHHGKSHISFFFSKEKQQNPDTTLNEHDFCYPGPKPLSREAAIIMIADSVESASRSLVEPTVSRIKQLIKKIIDMKLNDDQLEDTDLTLRDLARIGAEFVPILIGVHHHRLEYPDKEKPIDARPKSPSRVRNSAKSNGEKAAGKSLSPAETDDIPAADLTRDN